MDSKVPSDRYGYLLGHLDEAGGVRGSGPGSGPSAGGNSSISGSCMTSSLTTTSTGAHLKVKITCDGRYAFVGCRTGPRVMMSINLHHYRHGKDPDESNNTSSQQEEDEDEEDKEEEDEEEEDDDEDIQKHFHSDTKLRVS